MKYPKGTTKIPDPHETVVGLLRHLLGIFMGTEVGQNNPQRYHKGTTTRSIKCRDSTVCQGPKGYPLEYHKVPKRYHKGPRSLRNGWGTFAVPFGDLWEL
jgi:hypothetical protein